MQDKSDLRAFAKNIRNSLTKEELSCISSKIVSNLLSLDIYKNSKNIMLFYPIKNEISLLDLLNYSDKNFYFPVVRDLEIYPVLFNKNLGFRTGKFGISEPVGDILDDFRLLDLVLVPALAVDIQGNRLGYGCGYYDRFLNKCNTNCVKAVPIYLDLYLKNIPTDCWDIPVDYVITEKHIAKI